MSIRQINTATLNQVKAEKVARVSTPLPNKPCDKLQGLSTSDESLKAAANAGKKLAKLFS
ncbi:hypothetical protein BTHERMOSOX_647 [Bathymodiolus thermophilus thioautotrophic gill symbiont]|uniref:Uncharacterized protein n=1 Tax=Bathymodiolus thermophilus thioautotrophic gill symbiont TaxID=2360 RepID=A0A1J5UIJ1_9GAMM|nr:hypothetical protein [Bathymodiolus thermophilus thioautotrophic gill symbiont]OIR25725.1 hypothetical protein BGC33_13905 [Bathymodiolus thermophilus thioautotrophic gill symbiont]CAB5505506.1 hypothetical protein THERMOS_2139 [Bathymodiolus thermophilus thioautotrophic gill symbiont]SGZ73858.1 hypothetical protein BTHERMOSOX_647 [Bathymodiolus thermophilus thioautotrophic gill symbiont]